MVKKVLNRVGDGGCTLFQCASSVRRPGYVSLSSTLRGKRDLTVMPVSSVPGCVDVVLLKLCRVQAVE